MADFPNLKSGQPAMYPATRAKTFRTGVHQFADGSEQRWRAAAPLTGWALEYRDINGYDVSLLRAFFVSTKGAFDRTFTITVPAGGTQYQNMAFDQDDFTAAESRPNRWTVTLRLRQVRKN